MLLRSMLLQARMNFCDVALTFMEANYAVAQPYFAHRKRAGRAIHVIAEALALHQSTTSNLMDKLLRRQLVRRKRDRMDSRVGHLYLTRAGERALRTAPVPARNVLLEALEHLSPERLRLLDRERTTLLQRIREVHCSRL